ncbi:MAG: hypothetical protein ACXV98_16205 [Ilumatobacteraceae bacterium]
MEEPSRHVTQRNGWAWCALAAVLFGAATPATKLIVDHVGAVTLAGLLYRHEHEHLPDIHHRHTH